MLNDRNQLEPPTSCDNCSSPRIKFCLNSIIYEENKGAWPYCYYCEDCDSTVGCHPNTNKPLGLMANSSTRRLRKKLHNLFDPIWQLNYLQRNDAYNWLGKALDFDGVCHIGLLTKEELKKAISILVVHQANEYIQFKRRKEKRNARSRSSREREGNRIIRRKFVERFDKSK